MKKYDHINIYDSNYRCARYGDYDKIDYDIFEHIIECFKKACVASVEQFKFFNNSEQLFSVSDEMFDVSDINHYMRFFPKRSFILTDAPVIAEDFGRASNNEIGLPIDIIEKYFRYEPLLINNVATLLPKKSLYEKPQIDFFTKTFNLLEFNFMIDKPDLPYMGALFSSRYFDVQDEVYREMISLDTYGKSIKNLKKLPRCIVIELPYFKTQRIEDFLELTIKYEKRFESLSNAISKITSACKNKNEIDKILIVEIKSAIEDIASLCETRKKELQIKGVSFVAGVGLTLIPIGLSTFLSLDPAMGSPISTVIGSSNLLSFKPALEKYFLDKYIISSNPFWILWRFGGGNPEVVVLIDKYFASIIDLQKTVLYIPNAMEPHVFSYEECFEWFKKTYDKYGISNVELCTF